MAYETILFDLADGVDGLTSASPWVGAPPGTSIWTKPLMPSARPSADWARPPITPRGATPSLTSAPRFLGH